MGKLIKIDHVNTHGDFEKLLSIARVLLQAVSLGQWFPCAGIDHRSGW